MNEEQKHQNQVDRRIGYAILALIIFLSVALIVFGYTLSKSAAAETRIVHFPQIGNLRIDDPVMLKGIQVGTIKKTDGTERGIYVTFITTQPLNLRADYQIENKDKGIMGDRLIMIEPGTNTAAAVPAGDTLHGIFREGISEVVGLAWQLSDLIDTFCVVSDRMLKGTSQKKSLVRQIDDMVNITDSTLARLTRMTDNLERTTSQQVDSIEHMTASLIAAESGITKTAPQKIAEVEKLLRLLNNGMAKLDTMSADINATVNTVNAPDGILWNDQGTTLSEKITSLRKAVNHLYDRMLKLKLYLQ
jgi:ABC-type transporter Mla subunit MlaD